MAKELVLMPQKKYEELLQNKQTDLLCNHEKSDINKNTEPTENFKNSQSEDVDKKTEPINDSDDRTTVQLGKEFTVKQQFIGKGLPGIPNRVLQKTKKSTKRKKKKDKYTMVLIISYVYVFVQIKQKVFKILTVLPYFAQYPKGKVVGSLNKCLLVYTILNSFSTILL